MWVRGLKQIVRVNTRSVIMSHPMWVRGLKHLQGKGHNLNRQSHPMWVRGLKHDKYQATFRYFVSHPMWVRGLKLCVLNIPQFLLVASYVGAWIETYVAEANNSWYSSRILCGCVD